MQISEIEVRRHRQRDGANDTIAVKAVVEPGDDALDVIDALDDIIRQRLFTPQPKAPAVKEVAPAAAEGASVPASPVQQQEPAPVVEAAPEPVVDPVKREDTEVHEIDVTSFTRRVAELAKSAGAGAVIAALKGRRVTDIPADERGPILIAIEGAAA